MYERLTLKDKGSVALFIQAIVERCSDTVSNADFFKRLSDGLILASTMPTSVRVRNQCKYVEGESRWCSELLTDLASFITGSAGLHCHAAGAESMGLDRRDIRAIHAVAIRTIMGHLQYRTKVMTRTVRMSSSQSSEVYECYDQFQDYLQHKAKSRDKVRRETEGYILIPVQPPPVLLQPCEPPKPTPYTAVHPGPAPGLTSRDMELQQLQRDVADKLIDQLQKPGINVTDLHALAAAQKFIKEERAQISREVPHFNYQPRQIPVLDYPVQAHNSLLILNNQGNETMSLGTPISHFNFARPAIEEIKFVYGISVKDLTLQRVTALLTERQQEVDRLKDLPHKPEVIKAQITKLKGEIKDILALANELFPVTE